MCHDLDSMPPIAPLAGAAVEHADRAASEDAWRRTLEFIDRHRTKP